jgi:hypothetical protein
LPITLFRFIFKKQSIMKNSEEVSPCNCRLHVKKQNLLKLLAAVLAACFPVLSAHTISTAQPLDARVTFTPATGGMVTGVFYVLLADSTGFSDVEVSLTDNLADSVVFSRVFEFDQTSGLPAGVSWLREGTRVFMGIGTHAQSVSWQAKARLRTTSGAWSNWYAFRFN